MFSEIDSDHGERRERAPRPGEWSGVHVRRFHGSGGVAGKAPAASAASKPTWTPWTSAEKLASEKELLGFYVTGHPLNPYRSVLLSAKYTQIAQLSTLEDRANLNLAGSLADVARKFTKKEGKPFAMVILEDLSGSIEMRCWNDVYSKCAKFLEAGAIISLSGSLDKRGEETNVRVKEVSLLKLPRAVVPVTPLRLHFQMEELRSDELGHLRDLLSESPGECPVELEFRRRDGRRIVIDAGAAHWVRRTPELESQLARRLVPG